MSTRPFASQLTVPPSVVPPSLGSGGAALAASGAEVLDVYRLIDYIAAQRSTEVEALPSGLVGPRSDPIMPIGRSTVELERSTYSVDDGGVTSRPSSTSMGPLVACSNECRGWRV